MNYRRLECEYQPAMTFGEIAAAMHTSPQVVWVIYARALHKLRRELQRKPAVRDAVLGLAKMKEQQRNVQILPDWGE